MLKKSHRLLLLLLSCITLFLFLKSNKEHKESLATVILVAVVVVEPRRVNIYKYFILFSLIGMAIVRYFFTPLFFVSTSAGMLCAYVLFKITKNKPKQVAEAI